MVTHYVQAGLIVLGASFGALLRWQLGIWLNTFSNHITIGTLVANWLGCFIIGCLMAMALHDHTKLLFITGFLGSFTTFSAFSNETVSKLIDQKWWDVLLLLSSHVLGGLLLTLCGVWITKMIIKI